MRIKDVRHATNKEWEVFFNLCPYATFFHSREWAEIWSNYPESNFIPAPKIITFSDGTEFLLPLSTKRIKWGLYKSYFNSPAGTYGGPLFKSEQKINPSHIQKLYKYLGDKSIYYRQNPYLEHAEWESLGWSKEDFTQAVDYSIGLSEVLDQLRKNQVYRKYKRAKESGLKLCKVTEKSVIEEYFKIYQACRKRWGDNASNNFSKSLFEQFNLNSSNIDFWVVKKDSKVICAGPFLKANNFHVVSWLTLADPKVLDSKPYEFIYYNLIKYYGEEGFNFFDLNPSGSHKGVIKSKEKFATKKITSNVYKSECRTEKTIHKLRRVFTYFNL